MKRSIIHTGLHSYVGQRTGHGIFWVEVSTPLRVRADTLDVTPAVGTLAANRSCGLVREGRPIAYNSRRGRSRTTRGAFRRRNPLQLAIMNATPSPKVSHSSQECNNDGDSQTALITPRTPAVVHGEVSTGRGLVRHIVLFRSGGRHVSVFGHRPGHRVSGLIQGRLARLLGNGRGKWAGRSRTRIKRRALSLIRDRDRLRKPQKRSRGGGGQHGFIRDAIPVVFMRRNCRERVRHRRSYQW